MDQTKKKTARKASPPKLNPRPPKHKTRTLRTKSLRTRSPRTESPRKKSLPTKRASGALHPSAKKRSVPVGRPIPCATAPAAANGPGGPPAASKPAARPRRASRRRAYQTNYYVEVQGEFKPHGGHLLII